MISKKDIAENEFQTMEEYYEYILESEINGQRGQVKDFIADLSKQQKKDALRYFEGRAGDDLDIIRELLLIYL